MIQPTASPIAIPPITFSTIRPDVSQIENAPPIAAPTAALYRTSAVPSLTRLSPSISETMRRGTPSRPAISVAASASVGETIAPSVNATGQDRPTHSCATRATAAIVTPTKPNASKAIARRYVRKSRSEVKNAPE